MMNRISICGVPIDTLSRSEALERCYDFLHSNALRQVTTINPEFIVEAQKSTAFLAVLQKSDLALCDGVGVQFAAQWLHGTKLERMCGVDFMVDLGELAQRSGASVFFLGGRNAVAQKTAGVLQKRFPRLKIVGFSENIDISTYRHIDILFVALGAPKQELWIAQHREALQAQGVRIAMGVGGAFDFISGNIKRAPRFMRKLGFEWLWRFAMEPQRLKRICNAVFIFPAYLWIKRTKKKHISSA